MTHYFISDLHLHDSHPELIEAFTRYLDNIKEQAQSLYILGDFFEAWIGDDDDANWVLKLKQKLKTFTEQVPTYFIHGNRDFLIGETFAKETGVTLLPEQHQLELYGQHYLLMHGDELCTDDLQYQAFRQQVRSTQWQSAFLQASKEERRAVAKQLRNDSQSAQSEKSNEIMDANTQAITQAFTHSCCQTLIHGHTHRPNKHHYYIDNKEVTRLVLGDWGHQGKPEGWHLRISHEGALLESFPLS